MTKNRKQKWQNAILICSPELVDSSIVQKMYRICNMPATSPPAAHMRRHIRQGRSKSGFFQERGYRNPNFFRNITRSLHICTGSVRRHSYGHHKRKMEQIIVKKAFAGIISIHVLSVCGTRLMISQLILPVKEANRWPETPFNGLPYDLPTII